MKKLWKWTLWALVAALPILHHHAAYGFEIEDDHVIAFVGEAATVEMRRHGYLEAALTTRFHAQDLRFRNFGWQGDTVYEQLRMPNFPGFDENMAEHEVDIVFAWFGFVEAYAGQEQIGEFLIAYNQLLSSFIQHVDQLVLMSPIQQERFKPLGPDTQPQNDRLAIYTQAIRDLAAQREATFVNLFAVTPSDQEPRMTDNGIVPSAFGYWKMAPLIERELGFAPRRWNVYLDFEDSKLIETVGTEVSGLQAEREVIRFVSEDELLPYPRLHDPSDSPGPLVADQRWLRIDHLPEGQWQLYIDDAPIVSASAAQWQVGVRITSSPEYEQAEALLELIDHKNMLFFRYWRPANWDFVHGERKNVQASRHHAEDGRWFPDELEQYRPLIAEAEQQIQTLASPIQRNYQIRKDDE